MRTFATAVVGDTAPCEILAQFEAEYLERWLEDADALFRSDIPALQLWGFAEDKLAEIEQPVLNIRGENTPPFFGHVYLTLQKRLPHCESLMVPGASHALHQMAPRVVAQRIAEFVHGHASEEHGRAHSS
jgi:pimeloyl-ACP methyl ester carboxylesterase